MTYDMLISMNETYGRWTVVGERQGMHVPCRCACGTERLVSQSNLRQGISRSCGCLKAERTAETHTTHGTGYGDYRYRVWQTIKGKCLRATHADYRFYGGRGITMYEPWQADYTAFAAWLDAELGPRPEGYTLDRVDNSGNYEPGNLRWATRQEQALNRRSRWRNREKE